MNRTISFILSCHLLHYSIVTLLLPTSRDQVPNYLRCWSNPFVSCFLFYIISMFMHDIDDHMDTNNPIPATETIIWKLGFRNLPSDMFLPHRENPPSESTILAAQELFRILESNPDGVSCLDPIKDFNMRNIDFVENISRISKLEASMNSYKCVECPQFTQHFAQVRRQSELCEELRRVRYLLSNESLELLPEYQQRIQVLKKLRFIDPEENVKLKGRVACGISNHELIVTELVFDNQLNDLHPTEIVALLSCFVCEQKKCSAPELTETLTKGVEMIKKKARDLAKIQIDCGVSLSVEEYVASFKIGLVQVVYEWSKGMSFKEITELTDIPEGTIVRCIQRLDETCRDVKSAAAIIGDPDLVDKMEQGSSLIKRDIVFAGSLYTS